MRTEMMLELWDAQSGEGLAAAGWARAVAGLTPEQAGWRAEGVGGERHSIWQIVHHVIFWLEVGLAQSRGEPGPTVEQVAARNFESPTERTGAAWDASVARLHQARASVRAVIETSPEVSKTWPYLMAHDNYHLGQIMMLRAMQGMAPID